MEMKKYKLNDVCLKITDGSHFSPKAVDFGYPMYSVKDMNEFGFNDSDYKMISEDDFKSLVAAGCRPQKDDVLIAKDGSYLKYAFVCKEEKDEVVLSSIAILRPNKNIIDPTFFSFLLRNPSVKKSMKYYVSGTALPRIVLDNFKKMEINIPGLSEQKKIGDMLSTLDKRIENLRAQNRVLEQTAKTIYDYTFLQCTGRQTTYNKTLNRNIPEDWEVKNMSELAEVVNGATPSTAEEGNFDGGIVWITPKDLSDQKSKFVYFGERTITQKGYDSCSTTLVPVNSILMSSRAPIGLVSIAKCELCTNQGFKTFVPKSEDYTEYLYYYLLTNMKKIEQLGSGTTFKEVSRGSLTSFPVIVPDKKTLDAFNSSIKPLFEKQLVNTKQIEALTTQRNTLLPLLMTGQVEV